MSDPGSRPRHKSETYEIAVSAVLTKRADTLGELLWLRDRAVALEGDLIALDRILKTFGYAKSESYKRAF